MKLLKNNNLFYWGKILLLYAPFVVSLIILKTKSGYEYDLWCFAEWAKYSFTEGLSNIYKSWTDYLPLYQYVLFCFGKIQGSVEAIADNIYKLKTLTIFFELGTTLMLFKMLEKKFKDTYKAVFFSLFYFLNLAVLYNCVIWGQIDGIVTFFIFGSIIFGYKKKLFLSLLFFVLALNTKLQAIIFLPVIGFLLLPIILNKSIIKKLIYSIVGIGIIQLLIFLPFIYAGDFSQLWNVVTNSVGKFPQVSMNAYNMWYFFIENPGDILDTNIFLGITFKTWGLILFFSTGFLALLHLIKPFILNLYKKIEFKYSLRKLMISCALIPLLFFFFNTQMHERYVHPAFIFLAVYAMLYSKPVVFILGSLAYFLNMENVLRFFQTNNYHTLVFTPWFIACIYFLVIILLFIDLYDVKLNKKNKNYEKNSFHSCSNIQ
jgi:Gpi18-like mannosyltransferase